MITTIQLSDFTEQLLDHAHISDASQNGLQVSAGDMRPVKKICTAVDSGMAVLEAAAHRKADILLVHHGLLWGKSFPVTGIYGEKVRFCVEQGLSLFASHLPLDTHKTLGNSAQLAHHFGLRSVQRGFHHGRTPIGVAGNLKNAASAKDFVAKAKKLTGEPNIRLLPFGPKKIRSVGIVSGGTSTLFDYPEVDQVDLLITGEPRQSNFHDAQDRGVNLMFIGHYASETVGVRALGALLQKRFKIAHEFIDLPTGI